MRFINAKKKCISRLVIIIGNNPLEEVLGYQVTIAMLWPLRFHQLHLARFKKPGGKDRRVPKNSGMIYGIRVPKKAKEAAQLDKENGNLLWQNAILK